MACLVLFWSTAALAEAPNVDTANAAQRAAAQQEYDAALQHFQAGEYDAALAGFRKSYETVRSPNSHFMIARSLARQGRNVEAYAELTRVINEARTLFGTRYVDTIQAAQAKQSDIRPRIALVTVRAAKMPEKTTYEVEGQSLTAADLSDPVPALPGKIHVVAKLPDGRTVERETHVIAGETGTVDLDLPAAETTTGKPAAVVDNRAHIERKGKHPRYTFELEGHVMYTTIEPPGAIDRGFGPGVRGSLPIVPEGLIPALNDSLAVSTGLDYAATAAADHIYIPVVLQWNLWVLPGFSGFFEPGIAILTARGTHVLPNFELGARFFVVPDKVSITARAGVPTVSLGVSVFL